MADGRTFVVFGNYAEAVFPKVVFRVKQDDILVRKCILARPWLISITLADAWQSVLNDQQAPRHQ